ncbi:hypothetical protein V8E55_011679 [Tylopilus felleus]
MANGAFVCTPLPRTFNESLVTEGKVSISESVPHRVWRPSGRRRNPPFTSQGVYSESRGPVQTVSDTTVNPNATPTRIKNIILVSRPGELGEAATWPGMNLSSKGVICLGEALTKHIRATVKETQPLHEADAILREFATDCLVVPGRLYNGPGLGIVGAWKYPVRSKTDGMGPKWARWARWEVGR